MKRLTVWMLVCVGMGTWGGVAGAAVLCSKKSGVVTVRETACKRKETALDPSSLGLVGPPGAPGSPGSQGAQGIPGDPGTPGPGAKWALVAANGTVLAQSGGISVTIPGLPYAFFVNFGTSIAGKAILTTVRWKSPDGNTGVANAIACGAGNGGGPDSITCLPGTNTTSHVYVETSTNDVLGARDFYIAAID